MKRVSSTDFLSIHVTTILGERPKKAPKKAARYIPEGYIIKPAKQGVLRLAEYGLDPDLLIVRSELPLSNQAKDRLSEATGIPIAEIFDDPDEANIYSIINTFRNQAIDEIINKKLGVESSSKRNGHIDGYLKKREKLTGNISIAIIGNTEGWDSYNTLKEALDHAAVDLGLNISTSWLKTPSNNRLGQYDGFVITEGLENTKRKMDIARYCRQKALPVLGISSGAHIMLADFCQEKLKLPNLFQEQSNEDNCLILKRKMRVGGRNTHANTFLKEIYGRTVIRERHRHHGEVNLAYVPVLEKLGVQIIGTSKEGIIDAFRILDTESLGVLYHPEYTSRPSLPNPIIRYFLKKAIYLKENETTLS